MKIFFDGGCRPNPGPIEVAVVARGACYFRDDLGSGTNNDAEWLALLEGLTVAGQLGVTDVVLVGDALAIIAQAKGRQQCRGAARHLQTFHLQKRSFASIRLRHVGRHQNLAGIALERRRAGP